MPLGWEGVAAHVPAKESGVLYLWVSENTKGDLREFPWCLLGKPRDLEGVEVRGSAGSYSAKPWSPLGAGLRAPGCHVVL